MKYSSLDTLSIDAALFALRRSPARLYFDLQQHGEAGGQGRVLPFPKSWSYNIVFFIP